MFWPMLVCIVVTIRIWPWNLGTSLKAGVSTDSAIVVRFAFRAAHSECLDMIQLY